MELANFIVCDDIRREVNGKHMLIGVYDTLTLNLPKGQSVFWPLTLRLAFFIKVIDPRHEFDSDAYEFVVSQENEQITVISGQTSMIQAAPLEFIILALTAPALGLLKPSQLDFKLRFSKDGNIINELSPPSLKVIIAEAK